MKSNNTPKLKSQPNHYFVMASNDFETFTVLFVIPGERVVSEVK